MADTTNQPTTTAPTSSWLQWIDAAKEVVSAGVGVAKDIAGIKLTEAQAKAVKNQKAEPNWTMIGIVAGLCVFGVVAIVLVIAGMRRRRG